MKFLPTRAACNENSERESTTITNIYIFVWISILANLTPPNKQPFEVKSEFNSSDALCLCI